MGSPFRPRAIPRPGFGPARRPVAGPTPNAVEGPGPRPFVIPYEHCAVFSLTGRPGNILQDVITVSPEGVFVATAMGYGFDEERGRPLELNIVNPNDPLPPGDITLGEIPATALIDGVRVNPA